MDDERITAIGVSNGERAPPSLIFTCSVSAEAAWDSILSLASIACLERLHNLRTETSDLHHLVLNGVRMPCGDVYKTDS